MKTRIKPATITRNDAERLVNEIATEEANRRQLASEMDEQILALRALYGPQIDAHAASLKAKTQLVQAWADANPDEFSKRKSVDFPAGRIGYRTGTPKLKCLAGHTFAKILDKLLSLPWGEAFVRVKSEVDKEGIIAQVAQGNLQPAELREIGVKVEQDETFFVEPDLSKFENRITQEAA